MSLLRFLPTATPIAMMADISSNLVMQVLSVLDPVVRIVKVYNLLAFKEFTGGHFRTVSRTWALLSS